MIQWYNSNFEGDKQYLKVMFLGYMYNISCNCEFFMRVICIIQVVMVSFYVSYMYNTSCNCEFLCGLHV